MKREATTQKRKAWSASTIAIIGAILVIFMALWFLVELPSLRKVRIRSAEQDVEYIHSASIRYMEKMQTCPTLESLKQAKLLKKIHGDVDPWGGGYIIRCFKDKRIEVRCKGPDQKAGTEDDIFYCSALAKLK